MSKKIGIIGWGTVGKATGRGFKKKNGDNIYVYDPWKDSDNEVPIDMFRSVDIAFLCLPTPDEKQSYITDFLDTNLKYMIESTIVLRSTVMPGTTKELSENRAGGFVKCWEGINLIKPKISSFSKLGRIFFSFSSSLLL